MCRLTGLVFPVAVAVLFASVDHVHTAAPAQVDPGALVRTTANSTVGVLLDELPPNMRGRVAGELVKKPASFWIARAAQQLRLTSYRLVFREFFYNKTKKQLPLPPEPLWTITLAGQPRRTTIQGHDLVVVDYRFSSVLLTDVDSPGVSEGKLRQTGGVWDEPFVFPIDPEMLLQRTGYACMDEDSFPFNSVDSEEADSFYDQTCTAEKTPGNEGQCHYSQLVNRSCVKARRGRDREDRNLGAVRAARMGRGPGRQRSLR